SILKEQGYRVRPVPSGDFALRAVAIDLPDLVLLDISMPAMDGFEVCRRLKAEPATAEIPVIFLTAHTDVSEKVKAFGVGGVDYITKPFQTEEIRARVATHLENARQKKELRESYRRLGELETMRNSLVHMLVHDLRSPLTSISGLLELMSMEADKLPEDTRADLVDCRSGVQKMIGMVTAVLDVSKMEAGEMPVNPGACDAVRVTQQVVQEMRGMASQHNVTVTAATDA